MFLCLNCPLNHDTYTSEDRKAEKAGNSKRFFFFVLFCYFFFFFVVVVFLLLLLLFFCFVLFLLFVFFVFFVLFLFLFRFVFMVSWPQSPRSIAQSWPTEAIWNVLIQLTSFSFCLIKLVTISLSVNSSIFSWVALIIDTHFYNCSIISGYYLIITIIYSNTLVDITLLEHD